MNTDPIADLLTRIRNAIKANHEEAVIPHSKLKENVLKVMKQYGFIEDFKAEGEGAKKSLVVKLKENRLDLSLRRISKPGQRIYVKREDIRQIKRGLGITIISTSKGVMSNVEARKQNIGGEIICEVI